jgi:hypothetical protein
MTKSAAHLMLHIKEDLTLGSIQIDSQQVGLDFRFSVFPLHQTLLAVSVLWENVYYV